MPRACERFRKNTVLGAMLVVVVLSVLSLSSCGGVSNAIGGGSGGGGSNVEGPPRDTTPVVREVSQPGTAVVADERAVLDFSNAADGYICALSNLDVVVKVLVDFKDVKYQYTISSPGSFIVIPLSEGTGTYSVGVWQHVTGDSYAAVFSQVIDAVITDEFSPFLYPNQFVNFTAGDPTTAMSQQLSEGSVTDVDAINNMYKWIADNFEYDMEKATTVASGYLPNNTETLSSMTGICFDVAVLTASMLRAQRIPAQLVVGFSGPAYHAWIEVYAVDTGSVLRYTFRGNEWVEMDPTFDAAAANAPALASVIGDGNSRQPMLRY